MADFLVFVRNGTLQLQCAPRHILRAGISVIVNGRKPLLVHYKNFQIILNGSGTDPTLFV